MYFTNISDSELIQYHQQVQNRFVMSLMDILSSNLFKIETIVSNSVYKIYPLFYCSNISSNNSNDHILENKCIICEKKDTTFITFESDVKLGVDVDLGYIYVRNFGIKVYCFDVNTNLPVEGVGVIMIKEGNEYTSITNEKGLAYIYYPTRVPLPNIRLIYNGETINVV